jgi:glycerophosphoryl diester phosphodiesterase
MVVHRVAHRGYSAVAPENTLPALAAAALAGATYVEFDVRTTADGVPVVLHDRTVDRTTDGTGHVWELTVEEIRALDAGSWFAPAYAGTRVPLLEEALDMPMPALLLEIKPPASRAEVKRIMGMVADRGLFERTVVQSFDAEVIRVVRDEAPETRRGLLRLRFEPDTVPLTRELDVAWCNPSVADVLGDPDTVAELTDAGVDVLPWVANDIDQWPALLDAGVAGLITDRVGELSGWVRTSPPAPAPAPPPAPRPGSPEPVRP